MQLSHTSRTRFHATALLLSVSVAMLVAQSTRGLHSGKPPAGTPAFSTLPPVPPISPASALLQTPARAPQQRADIHFAQGMLSVNANNSSLNQILRDIARLTGMSITGGVTDERVYGSYGPAPAPEILASLLDGTGSNMLLLQSSTDAPTELVLSPRHGGPTPPNPNAQSADDNDLPPRQMGGRGFPNQSPQPSQVLQQQTPQEFAPQLQAPVQPQQDTRIQDNPNPPPPAASNPSSITPPGADSTQQQSPNGVKTPQQIYEQLLRMQQQQKQPQ